MACVVIDVRTGSGCCCCRCGAAAAGHTEQLAAHGAGRRQSSGRGGYCWAGLHLCAASIRDLIPHLVRLLLKSLAARAFTLHCALAAPPHPALRASWTIFRRCAMQGLFQGSAAGIAASRPPPAASAASRPLLQPWRLVAAPRPTAACACRCTSPGRRCWCMESSASRAGAGPLPTAGGCGLPPLCSSRPRSRSRWGRRPAHAHARGSGHALYVAEPRLTAVPPTGARGILPQRARCRCGRRPRHQR